MKIGPRKQISNFTRLAHYASSPLAGSYPSASIPAAWSLGSVARPMAFSAGEARGFGPVRFKN